MRTGGHGATKVKMLNEKKNNITQRGLFRVWQTTKNVIYNRILFLILFHPPKTNLIWHFPRRKWRSQLLLIIFFFPKISFCSVTFVCVSFVLCSRPSTCLRLFRFCLLLSPPGAVITYEFMRKTFHSLNVSFWGYLTEEGTWQLIRQSGAQPRGHVVADDQNETKPQPNVKVSAIWVGVHKTAHHLISAPI